MAVQFEVGSSVGNTMIHSDIGLPNATDSGSDDMTINSDMLSCMDCM